MGKWSEADVGASCCPRRDKRFITPLVQLGKLTGGRASARLKLPHRFDRPSHDAEAVQNNTHFRLNLTVKACLRSRSPQSVSILLFHIQWERANESG
jgi:hypothetical protein